MDKSSTYPQKPHTSL